MITNTSLIIAYIIKENKQDHWVFISVSILIIRAISSSLPVKLIILMVPNWLNLSKSNDTYGSFDVCSFHTMIIIMETIRTHQW